MAHERRRRRGSDGGAVADAAEAEAEGDGEGIAGARGQDDPSLTERLAQMQRRADEMNEKRRRAEEMVKALMEREPRGAGAASAAGEPPPPPPPAPPPASEQTAEALNALVAAKVDEAVARKMTELTAQMNRLVTRKVYSMMTIVEERMTQKLEMMMHEQMAGLLVPPGDDSTGEHVSPVHRVITDLVPKLFVGFFETPESEVRRLLETAIDSRLESRLGGAGGVTPRRRAAPSTPQGAGSSEAVSLEDRVSSLEAALQRALDCMFPRVNALLSRLEGSAESEAMPGRSVDVQVTPSSEPSGPLEAPSPEAAAPWETPAAQPADVDRSYQTPPAFGPGFGPPFAAPPGADSQGHLSGEALRRAASSGDERLVAALLAAGVDVNERDIFNATALHCAAENGHLRTLRVLLRRGADPAAKNHSGWTALHVAARWGHVECVRALAAGAEREARDSWGRTPLHVAAQWGRDAAARDLVRAGASLLSQDARGHTPEDLAASIAVRDLLLTPRLPPLSPTAASDDDPDPGAGLALA